jgi:hypothetical protein
MTKVVRRHKSKWMDDAASWNRQWGEMYTPEDIRQMIEAFMEDLNPCVWFLWRKFEETETTPEDLGVVHHYKMEWEEIDEVSEREDDGALIQT